MYLKKEDLDNSVRAVPVRVGERFFLSSDAHGFSYGRLGIEVGDTFTQYHSGGDFIKIPRDYCAPIKFLVLSKTYINNKWHHKVFRKVFKHMFFEFDMMVEIVEV